MRESSQVSQQVRSERDQSGRSVQSGTSEVSQEVTPWCLIRVRAGSVLVHRALEGGGAPAVVDMSVDDSAQKSQVRVSGNRFAVVSDDAEDSERQGAAARTRRRLVWVSQNPDPDADDHEWFQTPRASDEFLMWKMVMFQNRQCWKPQFWRRRTRAFASLDSVNLLDTFKHRPRLMQVVPWVLRGAFRSRQFRRPCKRCWQGQRRMTR